MIRGGERADPSFSPSVGSVRLDVSTRKSGGRDQWSAPLQETPADPVSAVWSCLHEVLDPEIPVSLVDLGLIYGVEVMGRSVHLRLTFTATACPCMATRFAIEPPLVSKP